MKPRKPTKMHTCYWNLYVTYSYLDPGENFTMNFPFSIAILRSDPLCLGTTLFSTHLRHCHVAGYMDSECLGSASPSIRRLLPITHSKTLIGKQPPTFDYLPTVARCLVFLFLPTSGLSPLLMLSNRPTAQQPDSPSAARPLYVV